MRGPLVRDSRYRYSFAGNRCICLSTGLSGDSNLRIHRREHQLHSGSSHQSGYRYASLSDYVSHGLVGIFAAVAAYLNYRQTRRIADEKLWVESFQKACEMVAKDKASSMQAGGIALLEFLVRNAEPLYWPAIEVLADHLRWTVPNDPKQKLPISHSASAVLNCFGDPSWRRLEDESTFYIDLSKLGIREGWLVDLQFNHFMMHDCVFESTDLTRAWFNDVQFDRTEFINCDFDGCTFVNCQFDGCLFIKPKNLNGTVRKQLEKAACTFH